MPPLGGGRGEESHSRRDKTLGRFLSSIRSSFAHHKTRAEASDEAATSADQGHSVSQGKALRSQSPEGTPSGTPSTNASSSIRMGGSDGTPRASPTRGGLVHVPPGVSSQRDRLSAISAALKQTDDHASPNPTVTASSRSLAKSLDDRTPLGESSPKQQSASATRDAATPTAQTDGPLGSLTRFSWRVAKAFIMLKCQPADSFSICGIPFHAWPKTKIPTLGASPASCRVQEMYKVTLPSVGDRGEDVRLFVKVVPIGMWKAQWEAQNRWNGEYATDGENFVMEAAVLAFLHEYASGIAPKLLGVLELMGSSNLVNDRTAGSRSQVLQMRRRDEAITHMVIVSELYGEDLLDYLDNRDRNDRALTTEEKRALQVACALLMRRLHALGLAHLDFTPENILVGDQGLRLCDFAKVTPLWSPRLRHVGIADPSGAAMCPFESCEPTVGKGAYMPPECWKIYWKLENAKILKPLDDLAPLRTPDERMPFYFRVSSADIYMLGVVIFWIWSEGGIWRCSDPRQDEKYYLLMKSGMNFDLFRECRTWPPALKDFLAKALKPEPWRRATATEIVGDPWCATFLRDHPNNPHLLSFCHASVLEGLVPTAAGPANANSDEPWPHLKRTREQSVYSRQGKLS